MSEDIVGAVVTFLKADAGVAALVATRVFGLELPAAEAASMPRKGVVVASSGGSSFAAGSFIDHDTQRLDLFSFGETLFEAGRVRSAVSDALRGLRRGKIGTTLVHWIEPAGGWASQRATKLEWPRAFQSFQALYALEAA